MKKIIQTITWYQCDICKTKYEKASDAEKCEARTLEEKKFKVGDLVQAIEKRQCLSSEGSKEYICKGKIVKIIGPMAPDEEYEIKWLNSERLNNHVWEYEIEYICPHCGEKKGARYYAPEIRKTK